MTKIDVIIRGGLQQLSVCSLLKNNFCLSPFPNVAESIQKELDEYKASEGEVKRLKSIMVCDIL